MSRGISFVSDDIGMFSFLPVRPLVSLLETPIRECLPRCATVTAITVALPSFSYRLKLETAIG